MNKSFLPYSQSEYKFLFKTPINDIIDTKIGYPKESKYNITLLNIDTGNRFQIDNVQIVKYKRNKLIDHLFEVYGNTENYSLIESSFPYSTTTNLSNILNCIKSRCKRNGNIVLGYFWLLDVGRNQKIHYHLVLAYKKIEKLNNKLQKNLKFKYKGKKIYSSFINNNEAFKNYLKEKKVYEIGQNKRSFNKSIRFKTI